MLLNHPNARLAPVGTIVYLQDRIGRFDSPRFINPWQVVAWHNREVGAAAMERGGRYVNRYMRGGHLATVQSLRDGRIQRVADHLIRFALSL